MTTPTSSIASVPVTIPSPPPSAAQGGVAPFILFNTAPLTVGVVMAGQLDMMLVTVLVGIIWEHVSVCTPVVSDGVHMSLRTVVGTVAVTVIWRVSVTVVGDDDVIGHVHPSVLLCIGKMGPH